MPTPNRGRSSSTDPRFEQGLDDRADVVGADPVLRYQVAQPRAGRRQLRAAGRSAARSEDGEVARVRRTAHRRAPSPGTSTSTTPLGTCTVIGPTSAGATTPSPPPSIIAGPPMPRLLPSVAMITSHAAGQRRVAREAVPGDHGDQRYLPAQLGEQPERGHVELGDRRGCRCRPAGRPALGEDHHGQPLPPGQLEQPVGLAVVLDALRAGQHRVVVGHHRDRPAADRCRARHQPVGRGPLDQVLERPAAPLGGDDQRPVLHEGARRRPGPRRSRGRCGGPPGDAGRCVPAVGRPSRCGAAGSSRPGRGGSGRVGRLGSRAAGPVVVPRVEGGEEAPAATVSPACTARLVTIPAAGAATTCSIFMASSTRSSRARCDLVAGAGCHGHNRPVQRGADHGLVPVRRCGGRRGRRGQGRGQGGRGRSGRAGGGADSGRAVAAVGSRPG